MAINVLDKYGIKEVADVTFYKITDTGDRGAPVLYLDTLKVSTIEQTAEEAIAQGGKGNPPLITWDYGKEINVTLEDALFSAKSMAIMFSGNDQVGTAMESIYKTITWTPKTTDEAIPRTFKGPLGKDFTFKLNTAITVYDGANNGAVTTVTPTAADDSFTATVSSGHPYLVTGLVDVKDTGTIEISANTFPGNYYVTGDTYARKEATGEDEFFQFIIPKAKVTSENTITLEAEGDPSVFNLNLKVLRPAGGGPMMKLVKYNIE